MNAVPTIEDMQGKTNKMLDMLTKREIERRLDVQKGKDDRRHYVAENEKLDYFERSFAEKLQEIKTTLDDSEKIPVKELADHFDNISKNILTLQKYVAASNLFLTTYNIKVYQQKLQELTNFAKDLEDKLLPKKKFGFKNKNKEMKNVQIKIEDTKENLQIGNLQIGNGKKNGHSIDEVDYKKSLIIKYDDNFCGFKNRVGEIIELKAGEMLKKDVALTNLEKCTVKLFGAPSTLHMSHLKNCYVFCGPVSTSIFAENCENCTFVIACQQLRLHSSTNINIYLHVTSRGIMEDCNKIYLAPYNLCYLGIRNDFNASGLDINTNHWSDADDFNWLHLEKQSPNWNLLEDAKIVENWDHMINAT